MLEVVVLERTSGMNGGIVLMLPDEIIFPFGPGVSVEINVGSTGPFTRTGLAVSNRRIVSRMSAPIV